MLEIVEYDSFTKEKGKGNPAGVAYLGNQVLENASMQEIAKSVGFTETVFISNDLDSLRFRYFTPGHEIDLCGHATIAAVGFLHDRKNLSSLDFQVNTNIGKINICVRSDDFAEPLVFMQQGESSFLDFNGSATHLAQALGISTSDIDDSIPIIYGSTGTWTLLIPMKNEHSLEKMHSKNEMFPGILEAVPKSSIHPYCIRKLKSENIVYARHFSSPFSQTTEDPVTGTASGVIGEFLLRQNQDIGSFDFTVHQGKEIGRPGEVFVNAKRGTRVTISGNYVMGNILTRFS